MVGRFPVYKDGHYPFLNSVNLVRDIGPEETFCETFSDLNIWKSRLERVKTYLPVKGDMSD